MNCDWVKRPPKRLAMLISRTRARHNRLDSPRSRFLFGKVGVPAGRVDFFATLAIVATVKTFQSASRANWDIESFTYQATGVQGTEPKCVVYSSEMVIKWISRIPL